MSAQLNLCNLPPWIIASTEFNESPIPIEVQGIRASNRRLFQRLELIEDPTERAVIFNEYMSVKFYLHQWQLDTETTPDATMSLKNSYLRFLRGWGVDSNGVEGAALKGWVESRLGIPPIFHKELLKGSPEDDYSPYLMDRMRGSARTNSLNSQLDVLYTFTQYELSRRCGKQLHLTLYRGTWDKSEHQVVERLGRREFVVLLNNLSSFTSEREKAWEFGTTVWRVEVPLVKIFFFGALLPDSILKGENEYLVIGGRYRVQELLF